MEMKQIKSISIFSMIILFMVLFVQASAAYAQIPDKFINLKVLPKNIGKRDLINMMKGATRGLGVRCTFCHVGEGDDLSTFDFAADEKSHKVTARVMFSMVRQINEEFLPKIAENSEEPPQITCFTCHNGKEHPQLVRPPE